jgi:tetratricopeptide (TPR) repeat protein
MADKKLHVTCACGQTLAFRPEQAGGRFRCPACKEPLDLTAPGERETDPEPPRSARGAAPRAGGATPKRPGSGFTARPPAGAPPRPGAGSGLTSRRRPPAEEEDVVEDEAPSRGRSGMAARGRGAPPAQAVAAPVSPEAARKKKLMLIGGGGGALVLVLVIGGIFAMKGPGKPENAGKVSEGTEVWKSLSDGFRSAEKQDEIPARDAAYKKVLDSIEGTRALHDYGWPDFFKGRALSRMGKYSDAKAAFEVAIGKLGKEGQNFAKIERGLIAAHLQLESLLRSRRFRAGGVSLAPDPAAEEAGKAAVPDLKLADGTKETPFFPGALLSLAQAEANRIDSRPSEAIRHYETASSAASVAGYAQAAIGGLYYEVDKWELGMKSMEAALEADHGSGFTRLSTAWGLRRRVLADMTNKDAPLWLDRAIETADKAASEGHPAGPAAAACLRLDRAAMKYETGGDGKADLDEASAKADEALAKDSGDVSAQEIKAMATYLRATRDERAGKDARTALDGAINDLSKIAGDGKDFPALLNRGKVLLRRARAEAALNGNPGPYYDRAVKDFDAVRGNDGPGGGTVEPVLGSATARVEKAIEDAKKGADSTAVFDKVIKEMTAVINQYPNRLQALEARGLARWALSDALSKQGKTPEASKALDEALTDLDALFEKIPSYRVGEILVDAWIAQGEANIKADISPRGPLDNASRHIETLLKMSPSLSLQMRRGKALVRSADFSLKKKEDPRIQLSTAVSDFTAVLGGQPDNLDALYERGRALFLIAKAEQNTGQDSRINLTGAIKDLENLMAKDPNHKKGAFVVADAVLYSGQVEYKRGDDPFDTLARAVGKFEAATKIDDTNGEVWNGLGNAWFVTIVASRKRSKEYGPALELAENAYRKAIKLEHWVAIANLGVILVYQKRFDEAEKAWDEAIPKCPDRRAQIEEWRGPKFLGDMKKRLK